MSVSPTARSKKYLEDRGFVVGVVEKFNPYSKTRHDFPYKRDGGFADMLAYKPYVNGVLAIQATTDSNISARIGKIEKYQTLYDWTRSGNACVIHGWGKKGKAGKRKLWTIRIMVYDPAAREFPPFLGLQTISQESPLLSQSSM